MNPRISLCDCPNCTRTESAWMLAGFAGLGAWALISLYGLWILGRVIAALVVQSFTTF